MCGQVCKKRTDAWPGRSGNCYSRCSVRPPSLFVSRNRTPPKYPIISSQIQLLPSCAQFPQLFCQAVKWPNFCRFSKNFTMCTLVFGHFPTHNHLTNLGCRLPFAFVSEPGKLLDWNIDGLWEVLLEKTLDNCLRFMLERRGKWGDVVSANFRNGKLPWTVSKTRPT